MTDQTETDMPNIPGAGAASDAPRGEPERVHTPDLSAANMESGAMTQERISHHSAASGGADGAQTRPSDLVEDTLPGDGEELGGPAVDGDLAKPEEDQLIEALKDVVDPELGINVVDLGLVYGVHIDDDSAVTVDMTLTSAACPLTDVIEAQTDQALDGLSTRTTINWVWMPPWTPEKITDDGREQLRALGFNV